MLLRLNIYFHIKYGHIQDKSNSDDDDDINVENDD